MTVVDQGTVSGSVSESVSNPFTDLRKELNLSHAGLATKMHISKQALIRLEQGMFSEPLPTVLEFYTKYHGVSELQMRDAYEGFQHAMRAQHRRLFGGDLNGTPGVIHPFTQLKNRIGLNSTVIAKNLCIPQPTLVRFETKPKQQQSIPKTLEFVLYEIGYTTGEVRVLKTNYDLFRKGLWV